MIPLAGRNALALLLGMMLLAGPADAAGFDCRYAKSRVEKLICAHPELSRRDSEMKDVFDKIRSETSGVDGETGERIDPIGKDQTQWRETVRDLCQDTACLTRAYDARLQELRRNSSGALR